LQKSARNFALGFGCGKQIAYSGNEINKPL